MRTIQEIRHANLLRLIAEFGSIQALAKLTDYSHSQISQLRHQMPHSKTGLPRTIGDGVARGIELKAGKPRGWMDTEHTPTVMASTSHPATQTRSQLLSEAELALLAELRQLPAERIAAVLDQITQQITQDADRQMQAAKALIEKMDSLRQPDATPTGSKEPTNAEPHAANADESTRPAARAKRR